MANILSLPPELLMGISDHLSLAAQAAFKLTCRQIYHSTLSINVNKLRKSSVDPCTQLAINSYLTFDHHRSRCLLCKQWYPTSMFADASSSPTPSEEARQAEAILRRGSDDLGGPGMIESPPGACPWHKARLYRVIDCAHPTFMTVFAQIPALKNFSGSYKWISTMEKLCYHCGTVKGWGKCECDCETCGARSVRSFTRLVRCQSDVERFVFWKRGDEILVREWRGPLCVDMKVEILD